MANLDPEILAHIEWLGFVRPTGLVVSAPALVRAGAILDRRDMEGQQLLRSCVVDRTFDPKEGPVPHVPNFRIFAESVLGWSFSPRAYAGTDECPVTHELEMPLPEYDETLRPDFAVRELEPKEGLPPWQLLVRVLDPAEDFDCVVRNGGHLEASAHGRMERLLRHTGVLAGLLFNGRALRLLSAPRGESSGWLDFRVTDMMQTAGRPISTALRLLLGQPRLLSLPRAQRLASLLEDSRKFQNEVSERLAEQVLQALYEMLRGFQAAHDTSKGELLRAPLADQPDEVYRALLTVILRLVFLLFAEERDMLPEDETFLRYYSLASLYERLREDAALFPDTMDQRFGAWAQLLVVFRMVYDGAESGAMRLPMRHGVLFDPNRYTFLEGRQSVTTGHTREHFKPPLVPDGTVYRALEKLLVLDGERISYRALDVEQIGSVYETMMGFRLELATGRSTAIRSQKRNGAPTTVDLEVLLHEPAGRREKWLQDRTDRKLTDTIKRAMIAAVSIEDLHAALLPVIDLAATPDLVQKGAMVLEPSEERRRSGSHYTPRVLTEPIVRRTLNPILDRLRGDAGELLKPAQILALKVCDPAMGSGAFLVEACRQLGDALVEAWQGHGDTPMIPTDEDVVIYARRLVAQRCLYGVDKNPVAVDLAKMSLWLVTLAKEHALTFVDHALRSGDSLVGLSRSQLQGLNWHPQSAIEGVRAKEQIMKVAEMRREIREAEEHVSDSKLRELWDTVQSELGTLRLFGDLVLAAYFEEEKPKDRDRKRSEYAQAIVNGMAERYCGWLEKWRHAALAFSPFHWEIEFPEVFERDNPGFDAIFGNPPFMRGKAIGVTLGEQYRDYLTEMNPESNASADIVSFFFRRAFELLRHDGTLGFIATKTISKGDTRRAGLTFICTHGGSIYAAQRRLKWPGSAAVVVSTLHIIKGLHSAPVLDGVRVPIITAFLFSHGGHIDPIPLKANAAISFNGCALAGVGFTIDDDEPRATSVSRMNELISNDSRNSERVFPYLGGDEINNSPTQAHRRFVIYFNGMSLQEAARWPDLLDIVRQKVKPERDGANRAAHRERWWQFGDWRPGLFSAISGLDRMLCVVFVSQHLGFVWVPTNTIVSHNVGVFAADKDQFFCILQSRVHEIFATQLSSGLEDRQGYRPSDGFEPFPFPAGHLENARLAMLGKSYHDFRSELMVRNNEGLTKTYNRFHDPNERDPNVLRLRDSLAVIDRAVLDAYGWSDIRADCEFLLDYETDDEERGGTKKPWRYRWPDAVRDEVLGRLLELNAERAKEETRSGLAAKNKQSKKAKRVPEEPDTKDLFS